MFGNYVSVGDEKVWRGSVSFTILQNIIVELQKIRERSRY
jgi:hypothetical protein